MFTACLLLASRIPELACTIASMSAQISQDQIAVFRESTPSVMQLRLQEVEVCEYWSVIFSPRGIATLTKQDMTGFLSYAQNKRWREISKENVTSDMDRLRAALARLIDDSLPISERLDSLEPGRGPFAVQFLGKAKLTPILLVTHPREFGVWNDYSERALRGMGLFPEFEDRSHLDDQYVAVNRVLLDLAEKYQVSLWWLDVILERLARSIGS